MNQELGRIRKVFQTEGAACLGPGDEEERPIQETGNSERQVAEAQRPPLARSAQHLPPQLRPKPTQALANHFLLLPGAELPPPPPYIQNEQKEKRGRKRRKGGGRKRARSWA